MKLSGRVRICNRALPSLAMSPRPPERATLFIGSYVEKKEQVFLVIKTLKNPVGEKYNVIGNISKILTRFIDEGKATICFKYPPIDLVISAEKPKLLHFLNLIKNLIEKKIPLKSVQLTCLSNVTSKVTPKGRTKYVINNKSAYLSRENYPRSVEVLVINNAEMNKFDGQILRLQNLKVLNLENNSLLCLPPELDLIPNLRELYLKNNLFGRQNNWKWLSGPSLRNSLTLLDLSSNEVSLLPREICRLNNLKDLHLDSNKLKFLPLGIGLLPKLKVLQISNNCLYWMPGSFLKLRLDSLDVFQSCCPENESVKLMNKFNTVFQFSLLSISAAAVLKFRLPFGEETLPKTLVEYLEDACYCLCGVPTYPPEPGALVLLPTRKISSSSTFSSSDILMAARFCGSKCLRKFSKLTVQL